MANSITRCWERVELKFSKLELLERLLLPFSCIVPTSNRGVLVTLNVSQVNLTACDSVILQLLLKAASMLNVPGPTSSLRWPDSPGKDCRKSLKAEVGSLKTFGVVPPILKVPVFGAGAVKMAADSSSKFVAHPKPLPTVKG